MELTVNGKKQRVDTPPSRSLLSVLRDDLGMTGCKYGCGEGQCGACTVLLDGTPARSCQTKVIQASGRSITTVEGLAQDGRLHPLQQAFLDEEAMQCGYCTPGMILAALGLLRVTDEVGDEEIVAAMDGNICRCGSYPRILAAVRAAARAMKGGRR